MPQLGVWKDVYESWFGVTDFPNPPDLFVPVHREGFDRLIVVKQTLATSVIIAGLTRQLGKRGEKVWVNPDLGDPDQFTAGKWITRPETEWYAVWVRDYVEADEELANVSFNQHRRVKREILLASERLLLEAFHVETTGEHLDVSNWTLTASQDADGSVVCVYWNPGYRRLSVDWASTGGRSADLRAREVVSC